MQASPSPTPTPTPTPPPTDPCTFPSGYSTTDVVATLWACFNAIPLDPAIRSTTIAELRTLIDLYSFRDISKASGPPFNIAVDLSAGLDAIAAKTYTSDYAFHQDVWELFQVRGDDFISEEA